MKIVADLDGGREMENGLLTKLGSNVDTITKEGDDNHYALDDNHCALLRSHKSKIWIKLANIYSVVVKMRVGNNNLVLSLVV